MISKNKVVAAIELYETFVDEEIESIRILSPTSYQFKGYYHEYYVNISTNEVKISRPDPE